MSGIIEKFSQILKELAQYQNDPLILNDELDGPFFCDVLKAITEAIRDKSSDLQISSTTLESVRSSCSVFKNRAVHALIFEQLRPFCNEALQNRRRLGKAIFDFIDDVKAVRAISHLNLSCFNAEIFSLLPEILQQPDIMTYLSTTEFDTIFADIKHSQFFSDQDLHAWSLRSMRHVEKLLKDLIISEKTVKPTSHLGGEYQLDPLVLMRFKAQERYTRASQSAPTSPVKKEGVSTPLSRSLPDTPKEPLLVASSSSSSLPTHKAGMPAARSPFVPRLNLTNLSPQLHLDKSNDEPTSKRKCK